MLIQVDLQYAIKVRQETEVLNPQKCIRSSLESSREDRQDVEVLSKHI